MPLEIHLKFQWKSTGQMTILWEIPLGNQICWKIPPKINWKVPLKIRDDF